jgi:hypothetical protein
VGRGEENVPVTSSQSQPDGEGITGDDRVAPAAAGILYHRMFVDPTFAEQAFGDRLLDGVTDER